MLASLSLILLTALSLTTLNAQTPTPTANVTWDFPDRNLAEVTTYVQAVFVDNVRVTGNPICTGLTATSSRCTIGVGTLAPGPHSIAVEASLNNITARTQVNGINIGTNAPANPVNFRYQLNLTINVP